jgi:ubiquinone/menaquinone biosynthesis C-methylase UbiE
MSDSQPRKFVQNAENLADISDKSVDVYTITFIIRNCIHVDKVVKEAYKVLKKRGRFMCLEFSKVNNPLIGKQIQSHQMNSRTKNFIEENFILITKWSSSFLNHQLIKKKACQLESP